MTETNFRRDNHYVPCEYLKRWVSSPNRVWTYRLLVPHENVPLWKASSIRGVAYRSYLYTRSAAGFESDEIEQWFEREYETPAEDVLQKATSDSELTPSDWRVLVRFVAAQDVRTPARLIENLQRWYGTLQPLIEETLQKSVQKLEAMKSRGEEIPRSHSTLADYFPLHITIQRESGQESAIIKAETIVGRGLWLFGIKHLLTSTANILHKHRWTILFAPTGVKWVTSDDPVIRLNYQDPEHYDFCGGWGKEGTDIFMPLSPRHLLFTQVGRRPPPRGTELSHEKAKMILRLTAEHAHRFIFAVEQDSNVPILRPRTVSADLFREETLQWSKWHEEQTVAERKLAGWAEELKGPNG